MILGGEEEKTEGNIMYKPYVFDEKELAKYYSAADLFIYPSLADSFGLVVTEPMACKTPIVTFKTGGIPEIITHNKHEIITSQHDITSFITGIDSIINDSETIRIMSENCREQVINNHTFDIMTAKYIELYNSFNKGE